MSNENVKLPKWTVLYNIVSPGSDWIGTGWEFFDEEIVAVSRYNELINQGHCPTKRPYYHRSDASHLGACHRYAAFSC